MEGKMKVEYITLSDEEQKQEAVRAIVTAQHELGARLEQYPQPSDPWNRQEGACEWLALVA